MTRTQTCPGCAIELAQSARYPRRYCPACLERATDVAGHALGFGNASMSGGLQWWRDGESARHDALAVICLIGSVRAVVTEARFGGVVAQPAEAAADTRGPVTDLSRPGGG